ncbi:MAG: chorismate-binding protein [Cytophagaceae bacterium]|nr:chorismate-binding protein [Cytophagaceae bacterium]
MEKIFTDISKSVSSFSDEEILRYFFNTSAFLNYPSAFWKLPKHDEIFYAADLTAQARTGKVNIHESDPGFVFSPFMNNENKKSIFIKASLFFQLNSKKFDIDPQVEKEEKSRATINEILKFSIGKYEWNNSLLPDINISPGSKEDYIQKVELAIERINKGEFKKVVLARKKSVSLGSSLHPVDIFKRLTNKYPASFVSLVNIPGMGAWVGASPELLVSVDDKNIFRTIALAGTQAYNEQEGLSKAVWTQKEIEEQAFVSRYIINCFKTIRVREFDEEGPRTVQAGNLIHLKTDFAIDMNEVKYPELGTVMLDLLHPTSAVCGMPKEPALKFITENENIDRKFYSGFLGPVNIKNNTCVFVNIRCAELGNQKAIVYSGAGITSESIAEKEFLETELKMKTIGNVLNGEF